MEKESKHTKREWRFTSEKQKASLYFDKTNYSCFANIEFHSGHDAKACMSRIVTAVNLHEELVEAAKKSYAILSDVHNSWPARNTHEGQFLLVNLQELLKKYETK